MAKAKVSNRRSRLNSRVYLKQTEHPAKISARVIDENIGINKIDNVRAVRISSGDYNVLIMADFAPMIGKIDGDVIIVQQDNEIAYRNIQGFFKHQQNEFTLLVDREEKKSPAKTVEINTPQADTAESAETDEAVSAAEPEENTAAEAEPTETAAETEEAAEAPAAETEEAAEPADTQEPEEAAEPETAEEPKPAASAQEETEK